MKIAGIILIILQCLACLASIISGKNPFSGGIMFSLGYFLCGIIGVILLVLHYKRKKKWDNDISVNSNDFEINKKCITEQNDKLYSNEQLQKDVNQFIKDAFLEIDNAPDINKIDKTLADKYSRMFRQSFKNVIYKEVSIINNMECIIYTFNPFSSEFFKIGGFCYMLEVPGQNPRFFASEYSYDNKYVLCEWVFEGEIEKAHINYGDVVSSLEDVNNHQNNLKQKISEILLNTEDNKKVAVVFNAPTVSNNGFTPYTDIVDCYEEPKDIDYIILKTSIEQVDFCNGSLYEATRRSWKLNVEHARQYKYVFSVIKSIVRCVYCVIEWRLITEGEYAGRYEFSGYEAPSEISNRFVGKRIPPQYSKQGLASPVLYKLQS